MSYFGSDKWHRKWKIVEGSYKIEFEHNITTVQINDFHLKCQGNRFQYKKIVEFTGSL